MPLGLAIDAGRLAALCRRYHVATLELFGSRAAGHERADSDVDLLVAFDNGYVPSLFAVDGYMALLGELESLFERPVDLLMRSAVESDENEYFRTSALRSTEVLYAA